jgi:hypothetical protein
MADIENILGAVTEENLGECGRRYCYGGLWHKSDNVIDGYGVTVE